jgi:hypothetical protein
MSYESSYPFITETLNGARQELEKKEEEYATLYNRLKGQLSDLQQEKKLLEEKRDSLKTNTAKRIGTEEEIKDLLFKSFMNAVWNAYKGMEKNAGMEDGMRKKEEAYEREYAQLMDEITSLNKEKNVSFPMNKKV